MWTLGHYLQTILLWEQNLNFLFSKFPLRPGRYLQKSLGPKLTFNTGMPRRNQLHSLTTFQLQTSTLVSGNPLSRVLVARFSLPQVLCQPTTVVALLAHRLSLVQLSVLFYDHRGREKYKFPQTLLVELSNRGFDNSGESNHSYMQSGLINKPEKRKSTEQNFGRL